MAFLASLLDRWFIKQPKVRQLITKALYGESDKFIELCGAELLVNSGLENGYLRAANAAKYLSVFRDELPVLLNLCNLIEDGSTFVDVGANVGLFSSVISRISSLKENADVYAFEVDPTTFARLRLNANRHGFTAFNVGILDRVADVTFVRGAVSHVTTAIERQNGYSIPQERFVARCVPLAHFEFPGSRLVIKVDVEGSEKEVLQGAQPLFQQRRVRAIYFDGANQPDHILASLGDLGFKFYDGRTLKIFDGAFSLLAMR